MRRAFALAAAASLLVNTACFSYVAAAPGALAPGADVRLELTAEGTSQLSAVLGPRIRSVTGQVQESVGDSATSMIVEELVTLDGASVPWTGRGRVTIANRDVGTVQLRKLDRQQTWIMGSTFVVAFVAVIVSAIHRAKSSGTSKTPPGSPPPELIR